jgi:hypothetical protein
LRLTTRRALSPISTSSTQTDSIKLELTMARKPRRTMMKMLRDLSSSISNVFILAREVRPRNRTSKRLLDCMKNIRKLRKQLKLVKKTVNHLKRRRK